MRSRKHTVFVLIPMAMKATGVQVRPVAVRTRACVSSSYLPSLVFTFCRIAGLHLPPYIDKSTGVSHTGGKVKTVRSHSPLVSVLSYLLRCFPFIARWVQRHSFSRRPHSVERTEVEMLQISPRKQAALTVEQNGTRDIIAEDNLGVFQAVELWDPGVHRKVAAAVVSTALPKSIA